MTVRTRVAVSPTGHPHIGTLYQALFDYAWAKKHKGQFVVRIEDTDRQRFVEDAEEALYVALDWFGIVEDESPRRGGKFAPYRQSERLKIYQKYAKELVEAGYAYYCICSKERLEMVRKQQQKAGKAPMYDGHCRELPPPTPPEGEGSHSISPPKGGGLRGGCACVIRLKVPRHTKIVVKDEIRGDISFDSNAVDDQVLLKSDGFPTYHLAVVVDDHLMKISHVIRGEEWMSSFPKHWLLYEYFGWEKPKFYHTPILRNPDRSKLSKRQGHTAVSWYRDSGFLPEAILNYLALMGWSHPKGKEIFSLEEFIRVFDLARIQTVGPIFDVAKLEWMNGEYVRKMKNENLKMKILGFFEKTYSEDLIEKTIPLIKERIKTLKEYDEYCRFFIERPKDYQIDLSEHVQLFKQLNIELKAIPAAQWKAGGIGERMQEFAKKEGIPNAKFFMILRVAITGKKVTPPLNESMEVLGKEECLARISRLTI